MWLWESELRELGFRRKSDRYWRCVRRFGLAEGEHLSLFSWSEQTLPPSAASAVRYFVELTEFHVTFLVGTDHVHFYYHETLDNVWRPGGHTSARWIRRLGRSPRALKARADRIASQLIMKLGGLLTSSRDASQ
jgi:hypothetical protein